MPTVIFERQKALGLEPLDVNILLHLSSYWWTVDNKPHPSKVTIARAIGVDPRTVQRRIAAMERDGLIKREERRIPERAAELTFITLDGLVNAALPFTKEKNR